MGKENIKLTISVLISGNKENVTRCLQSLDHLMQEVPSELILTDTGCSPEVRDLIENYTDRIINFTWCQDFSAARNVGLQEARGSGFCIWMMMNGLKIQKFIENFCCQNNVMSIKWPFINNVIIWIWKENIPRP